MKKESNRKGIGGRPRARKLNQQQIVSRLSAIVECGERATRAISTLQLLDGSDPDDVQLTSAHADTEPHIQYLMSFVDRINAEIRKVIE